MATRLDRLFVLLDTGSTPVVRKTAAEQLGQVQKLHPHELNNLLTKVNFYLGSSTWESRIAAGQAVDAICRNVPKWNPSPRNEATESDPSPILCEGRLSLSQFDVIQVLRTGAALCGSEGTEYDTAEETDLVDPEKLARQKQLLNKRLGLDVAGGLGGGELFAEEDLIVNRSESNMDTQSSCSVMDLVNKQLSQDMSARERNRAKRKAKRIIRQVSNDPENIRNGGSNSSDSTSKMRKTSSVVVEQPDTDKVLLDSVPDNTLNTEDLEEWPFETFCDQLTADLFNAAWEKRHGAATALREVVKSHGTGAGKLPDMTASHIQAANQFWLEDAAIRLICVLALDRFGDFVSDEVVAPVRETCAQTLGAVLSLMDSSGVQAVVRVLLVLLHQPQWEVRHGSLLAFKYLLAVRQDLSAGLLPTVVPSILPGLTDQDDDVRAVAAAALLPVADSLVKTLPNLVIEILRFLWHILNDLDDLTASTGSVMNLLSSLLANPELPQNCISTHELPGLVPRLYPFLSHNICTVRQAALEAFITLLVKYNIPGDNVWILHILADSLRHVYQRCLLEERAGLLDTIYKLWQCLLNNITPIHIIQATSQWTGVWLSLMMQPSRLAFDGNLLIHAKYAAREMTPSRSRHLALHGPREHKDTKYYIGGSQSMNESALKRDKVVIQARVMAARLVGHLLSKVVVIDPSIPQNIETPQDALGKLLAYHLSTKSALQRMAVALVIIEWAKHQQPCQCPEFLKARLHQCLTEPVYYDEIAMSFTRTQSECRDFITGLRVNGVNLDSIYTPGSVLTLEQASALCTSVYDSVKDNLKGKAVDMCEDRRRCLQQTVEQTTLEQQVLNNRVQSSLAGAVTLLQSLPEKMNPVIRPLMETAKKEDNSQLQMCAACSLSRLLHTCVGRDPCPNPKVIKNLCTILCSDTLFTPQVMLETFGGGFEGKEEIGKKIVVTNKYQGILTLWSQNQSCDIGPSGRGRKPNWVKKSVPKSVDLAVDMVIEETDEARKQVLTGRRGATLYLTQMVREFAESLPETMSPLWTTMTEPLVTEGGTQKGSDNDTEAQELVNSLQVLEVTGSAVHTQLHKKLLDLLPSLLILLQHPYTAVRHMTSRCLAMLTKLDTMTTMEFLLDYVIPLLGATDSDVKRQGGTEALANVIEHLGLDVIAYIVLIIVPVLGRMSDQNDCVRLMATHCFATLIKLLPLEAGIPDPPSMKATLVQRKTQERKFLEQLLDGTKVENYKVPMPIKAELRKYQQDGVNWMAFLNKYKLHGILCDDMGLGKTLQSLCILAGDNWNRKQAYQESKSADSSPLSSIVICPPTLTGHWVYEVEKFIDKDHLNPLHYTGPPAERVRLQKRVKKHNLVIASYDVVRNDIDFFSGIHWNYCILDEGHIIKNSKTKISKSVKQLNCNHRMILSGTPIQNNVLELWSLFDFLMPGFLGTEKQFQARYGRPILLSRDAKSSSKEQEAGALAMEALHRQVLPFLLRRMKEDVLKDLPPKIIQDYYCDLSPLQVKLYEDFAKSQAKKSVEDDVTEIDEQKKANVKSATHIFQALQYLRKLCNHPALVVNLQHPEYSNVMNHLKLQGTRLRDLQHAPKLTALRQLLLDCGIGLSDSDQTPVVNQHRVLLFCQLKSMLDIVENDLFKSEMKSVTYLRLDGSVPAGNRISIVNRFNNDPSIDVLLLTTHVGGLGLNLTGADTVIFVEHDWNPMKDLQAMDRAHRIGQKKVVTVYRLITRGTLEEKIMGLQKFKLNIANTVITQDNSSLASMATDQILDLFSLDEKQKAESAAGKSNQSEESAEKQGVKAVLENLEELWDEKQYEDEYDLSSFMKSLRK